MKPTLYRHFDGNGLLLYVGASLHPARRQVQHSMMAHWFDDVVSITLEQFPNRDSLLRGEIRAIRLENPVHNTAHKRHVSKPAPQPVAGPDSWSPVEYFRFLHLSPQDKSTIRRDRRSISTIVDDFRLTEQMVLFLKRGK